MLGLKLNGFILSDLLVWWLIQSKGSWTCVNAEMGPTDGITFRGSLNFILLPLSDITYSKKLNLNS